jgi:general nucleoside transport system permease protein
MSATEPTSSRTAPTLGASSNLALAWRAVQGPLLAILGAVGVGALLMLLSGHNPFTAYSAMLRGALVGPNLAATLTRGAPIVGMGLAAALAFRAGLFNLGGEGQLVLGGLTAALVALYVPLPAPLLLPLVVLSAALVGGLWALLPTWGQFAFRVPLLISSLLLNYPARLAASYVAVNLVRDVASGMPQTRRVPQPLELPLLVTGTQLHAGCC